MEAGAQQTLGSSGLTLRWAAMGLIPRKEAAAWLQPPGGPKPVGMRETPGRKGDLAGQPEGKREGGGKCWGLL